MGKYLNIDARDGLRKLLAYIVRIVYAPFSIQFLRKQAEKCITKFDNNKKCKKVQCFVGPDCTIPFRVDTLNNKSANSRGCFSFLVIPQQKN
ncbi:hypothetical protein, partial [Limosilactobacillus reuteri]|uniref:hypothetical protein n=1 Tax=Limosilactobacillus reuteri TaxID=1598 RepID=UPI0021A68E41